MTVRVTGIYCHPIKGIGREALDAVDLEAQAPLPGDRAWAVLHQNAAEDSAVWQPRRNFLVVASGPRLAQVVSASLPDGRISVTHPDAAPLIFDPATEGEALLAWAKPLWPEERPAPTRLVKAPEQGMADNGEAQVAILNLSSLRALSEKVGKPLQIERFRGNLIVDGLPPWGEFDLVGKTIRIGAASFSVTERIERCRATEASPETGTRDADTLRALEDGWGHRDFGIYATVTEGGRVAVGDLVVE